MEKWIGYYAAAFPWAHAEFKKLNEEYLEAVKDAHEHLGKYQLENAKHEAKRTGQRQKLTPEKHLAMIKELWKDKAHELARQQLNDNAALNEINPEIQREEKPKKTYTDNLSGKQDELAEKIEAEKQAKTFEAEIEAKREKYLTGSNIVTGRLDEDEREISWLEKSAYPADDEDKEYYVSQLKDHHGYTDEKVERGIKVIRKLDERDEALRKQSEASDALDELFSRERKHSHRM